MVPCFGRTAEPIRKRYYYTRRRQTFQSICLCNNFKCIGSFLHHNSGAAYEGGIPAPVDWNDISILGQNGVSVPYQ